MSSVSSAIRRPARGTGQFARTTARLAAPWPVVAMVTAGAAGMISVEMPMLARFTVGISVVGAFFLSSIRAREVPLNLVFVWLILLGFVRRLLIPFVGYPEFDPLLLIGPICGVVLWISGVRTERRERTAVSVLGFLLLVTAFAQVFNPAGGSAGPLAALFWIGPLIWFFVGRTVSPEQFQRVLKVAWVMLIPVVFHGLWQTYVDLLPFEYTWVGASGFGASIFIEGFRVRPFSTLMSPQEYGYFLSFGIVVLYSEILTNANRRGWKIALMLVSTFALFLQGSRGVFLFFSLAIIVVTAVRTRSAPVTLVIVSLVGGLIALGSMRVAAGPQGTGPKGVGEGASTANALVQHQISGFSDPASSTLPLHMEMIATGFDEAFRFPLGFGLGAQTIAVKKTNAQGASTENDVAATFHALGLFGGMIYLGFILACFVEAARRARRLSLASLATIGVMTAFVTQWWAGQMYAASSLLWITLGTLARPAVANIPRQVRRGA